jgi:hypothetical protein
MSEMNIIEAQLKFNKKLVILISGLSGTYKNRMAKDLAKYFNIDCKSLRAFINKDYDKVEVLSNGYKFIDYDNANAYDWNKLNTYVNEHSSVGIIIYGFAFPKDLINFTPDFHYNIKISKQKYIEERHIFLKKNSKKNKDLVELIGSVTENLMINDYIYPNYLDYIKRSVVYKYFNANENTTNKIFDELFDHIIAEIEKKLYMNKDHKDHKDHKDNKKVGKSNDDSDDSSSSCKKNDWDASDHPIGSTPDNESYIVATIPTNPNNVYY